MGSSELLAYMRDTAGQVDAAIDELLPAAVTRPAVIHEAMRYSVLGGGKRLRGILTVTACVAAGGRVADALPVAASIEMIHAYSLVHDDLPAMDDDDLRRGKPTTHIAFGEGMAVLAGDALLTHAFWALARLPRFADIDPDTALAVLREVTDAAGTAGLIGGQVADLAAEGRAEAVSLAELQSIHRRKTGALFRAAVRCGGLVARATDDVLAKLTTYAKALGLAFQIADDILDVVGDEASLGKRVGSDTARDKATYPALVGLERARAMADVAVTQACDAVHTLGPAADTLQRLARFAARRDN